MCLVRGKLTDCTLQGEEDFVTPETHAAAIKQRLKESDVEDKAEFRKRQKENKLALKIKLKKMLGKTEAIILSMTLKERRKPDILNASRRARIAKGSGTQVSDINALIKQFTQMLFLQVMQYA